MSSLFSAALMSSKAHATEDVSGVRCACRIKLSDSSGDYREGKFAAILTGEQMVSAYSGHLETAVVASLRATKIRVKVSWTKLLDGVLTAQPSTFYAGATLADMIVGANETLREALKRPAASTTAPPMTPSAAKQPAAVGRK